MAKTCEICGKHPMAGKTISHAHNVNKRLFLPNLRTVKMIFNGTRRKVTMCMKCLKAMSKD